MEEDWWDDEDMVFDVDEGDAGEVDVADDDGGPLPDRPIQGLPDELFPERFPVGREMANNTTVNTGPLTAPSAYALLAVQVDVTNGTASLPNYGIECCCFSTGTAATPRTPLLKPVSLGLSATATLSGTAQSKHFSLSRPCLRCSPRGCGDATRTTAKVSFTTTCTTY